MRISVSKKLPSAKELVGILKRDFSDKYSYEAFGLGNEKSILVKQSTFVGAQISIVNGEVQIDAVPPSVHASFISTILTMFFSLFILFAALPYRKLEKEIGLFLSKKYN